MVQLNEAMSYAQNPATTPEDLRRACEILLLPTSGPSDILRARLMRHLEGLDARKPVVCLNPEPLQRPVTGPGPRLPRPKPDEYREDDEAEIALVPEVADFAALLLAQLDVTRALAATFGEEHAGVRYAPDKWSVREVLGHLGDCERVNSYRLLRALRRDDTALASFDDASYMEAGRFESRKLADIVEELCAIRTSTASLVRNAAPGDFAFRARVGKGTITGLALAYLIAGHERHHQSLLRTRYLPSLPSVAA